MRNVVVCHLPVDYLEARPGMRSSRCPLVANVIGSSITDIFSVEMQHERNTECSKRKPRPHHRGFLLLSVYRRVPSQAASRCFFSEPQIDHFVMAITSAKGRVWQLRGYALDQGAAQCWRRFLCSGWKPSHESRKKRHLRTTLGSSPSGWRTSIPHFRRKMNAVKLAGGHSKRFKRSSR
jgi:hypothetical protein